MWWEHARPNRDDTTTGSDPAADSAAGEPYVAIVSRRTDDSRGFSRHITDYYRRCDASSGAR